VCEYRSSILADIQLDSLFRRVKRSRRRPDLISRAAIAHAVHHLLKARQRRRNFIRKEHENLLGREDHRCEPDQQLVKIIEKRIHRHEVVRLEDERSHALPLEGLTVALGAGLRAGTGRRDSLSLV
jgi:hypothetical protein